MVGIGGRIGLLHTQHIDEILQPVATYVPREGFVDKFRDFFVPVSGDESPAELKRRNIQGVVTLTPDGLVFRRVN